MGLNSFSKVILWQGVNTLNLGVQATLELKHQKILETF
jgi:hypothetical protein